MAKNDEDTNTDPVVEKDVQNGVPRPRSGTSTGRVWEICDELADGSKGELPARTAVVEVADREGINANTVSTQMARWRKYHGLNNPRIQKPEEQETAEQDEGNVA